MAPGSRDAFVLKLQQVVDRKRNAMFVVDRDVADVAATLARGAPAITTGGTTTDSFPSPTPNLPLSSQIEEVAYS